MYLQVVSDGMQLVWKTSWIELVLKYCELIPWYDII